MIVYFLIFFVFGSVMGSFIHCLSYRLSNHMSIVTPSSHCDKCGHKLKWYELIPLVSYAIQKGKCRKCQTKLSYSYVIIELVSGILYATCFHVFGFSLELVSSLIFISGLLSVIISDIEYMIILDEVIIAMGILLIIVSLFQNGLVMTFEKIGFGCLAFLTMYLIKLGGDALFKKESLGGGDIKILFIFGFVLGYPLSIVLIFLATFIAFPVAIVMLLINKDNLIPFGPFLCMAGIILLISSVSFSDIINFLLEI